MCSLNLKKIDSVSQGILFFMAIAASTIGTLRGGAWAAIVIAGSVLALLCVWREKKQFPRFNKQVSGFVAGFLLVAAVQALLSPYQDQALYMTFKLFTVFVPLSFLSMPDLIDKASVLYAKRNELWIALIFGFLMLCVALFLNAETYSDDAIHGTSSLTKFNRGFSHGILFVMPFLAIVSEKKGTQFYLLLAGILGAFLLTASRTTQAAVVAGAFVFVMASFFPVVMRRVLGMGMLLSVGWPFYARYAYEHMSELIFKLPASLVARFEIWDYMSYRIAENPFIGYGIGCSSKLDWAQPHGAIYQFTNGVAGHPHNAITQLWAEMGILGLLLGGLACFWLLGRIKRLSDAFVPYALATVAMAFVLLMAAYNLWTDALWGALVLTIFAFEALDSVVRAEN